MHDATYCVAQKLKNAECLVFYHKASEVTGVKDPDQIDQNLSVIDAPYVLSWHMSNFPSEVEVMKSVMNLNAT